MGVHRIPFILALGATAFAGTPALEPPASKSVASATVTVTAEAMPVEIIKTPNPVRVLDKAAIEATGARTLGDLLGNVFPGQVLANGGVGTLSSVHLGGSRPQDTIVTLDGVRLTDASGVGGVDANSLLLAGIDRVEVQLGPCSTRFGSDAMGGAVALYSAQNAPAGFSGDVRAGLGNMDIRQGALSTAYGWKGGWVRAAFQSSQEDQATPTNDPYRNVGTYLGVGQTLGEDTMATLSYRNGYTGVPIPWKTLTPGARGDYDPAREDRSRSQQIIGTLRSQLGAEWLGELTLGQAIQDRQEPNYGAPGFTPYSSRRDQATGHLAWTPAAGVTMNGGLDVYQEFASTPGYATGTNQGVGHHTAVSLEGNWEPTSQLRLVGSVRQQWDRQNFVFTGSATGQPDTTSSKATWKLGANHLLGAGFRVYASGGTAFSLPILYAVMYNANPANFATGPLNSERSSFSRVGAGWEQGPWSARLEASRTDFSHLVTFDLTNFNYENENSIRMQGLEGALTYKTAHWGAEGFWRNQEARDMKAPAGQQLSSAAVLRTPFNTFGAMAWTVLGALRLEGRWSWTGPHYENFGGYPAQLGASKVHFDDLSLGAVYALRANLSLGLRGDHLLQPKLTVQDWIASKADGKSDAYEIFGFPAQPPTVTLELRYRF